MSSAAIPLPEVLIECPMHGEDRGRLALIHNPEVRRHLDELLEADFDTGVIPDARAVAVELSRRLGVEVSARMLGSWRSADPEFWAHVDDRNKWIQEQVASRALFNCVERGEFQAIAFTLKNVAPEKWKDKQQVEHSVDDSFASLMVESRKRLSEARCKEIEADAQVIEGDES